MPDRADHGRSGLLLSIGDAAERVGVSTRALRYYQQLGLMTPSGCTPGGLRRYSEADVVRLLRIRELQTVLGFNLDEVAVVLRNEDRTTDLCRLCRDERTGSVEWRAVAIECLALQDELRITVETKREVLGGFLGDLEDSVGRLRRLLRESTPSSPVG
jgi:DNA-binding transcriptional MerR regulator